MLCRLSLRLAEERNDPITVNMHRGATFDGLVLWITGLAAREHAHGHIDRLVRTDDDWLFQPLDTCRLNRICGHASVRRQSHVVAWLRRWYNNISARRCHWLGHREPGITCPPDKVSQDTHVRVQVKSSQRFNPETVSLVTACKLRSKHRLAN